MTGGTAVILGAVGHNFGAGMTGGMAFVYDPDKRFDVIVNPESVIWKPVVTEHWTGVLKALIEEHVAKTKSVHARTILDNWALELPELRARRAEGIRAPARRAAGAEGGG